MLHKIKDINEFNVFILFPFLLIVSIIYINKVNLFTVVLSLLIVLNTYIVLSTIEERK